MTTLLKKRTITVDAYYQMAEDGLLPSDGRMELINGEIFTMSPVRSPHAGIVNFLSGWLNQHFLGQVTITTQNPIRINVTSEPEPDIAIAKYRKDCYRDKHPTPEDVFIAMEVSDTTLTKDRKIKKPLYAEAGIREYWIINILGKCVEVYLNPKGNKYQKKTTYFKGDTIEGKAFKFTLEVDEIFPK